MYACTSMKVNNCLVFNQISSTVANTWLCLKYGCLLFYRPFVTIHIISNHIEGIEGILWKRWRKQDGFLFKYLPTVIRDAITFKPEQSTKFIMSTLPLILLVYTLFVLDHCLQTNTNSKAAIELFLDLMHILV